MNLTGKWNVYIWIYCANSFIDSLYTLPVFQIIVFASVRMKADKPASSSANSPTRANSSSAAVGEAGGKHKSVVKGIILFVTLGCMIFMAATAALSIYDSNKVKDTGVVFVAVYMMIFSAILFCYEVLQTLPMDWLDEIFKQNFGFLYGVIGKCLFIIL
jgi:hypothetical protein